MCYYYLPGGFFYVFFSFSSLFTFNFNYPIMARYSLYFFKIPHHCVRIYVYSSLTEKHGLRKNEGFILFRGFLKNRPLLITFEYTLPLFSVYRRIIGLQTDFV